MPIAKIQLADGRIARLEVPEGTTQEQVMQFVSQNQGQFAQPEQPRTRRERRESQRAARPPVRDPFEGLPADVMADIESRFPLPEVTGKRSRAGSGQGRVINARKRAAELEQVRLINPAMAEQIEEVGDITLRPLGLDTGIELGDTAAATLVGAGRGLTNIGRAVGLAEDEDEAAKRAIEGLKTQTGAVTAGEILGESAPFLAVGGPLTGLAKTVGQRAIAGAALGATEGGLVTKGRGGSAKQIALGTLLGGVTGGLVPVASSGLGRSGSTRSGKLAAAREVLREPTNKEVAQAVKGAAPTSQELRDASKSIYNELSDSGVSVKPEAFEAFIAKTLKDAKDAGLLESKLGRKLTPQSSDILNVLDDMKTGKISFDELEGIRRSAQNSAGVANRAGNFADESINLTVVDSIDDFMKNINISSFSGGTKNVGAEVAAARNLWGRARKSELLDEAIERAKSQQSGFENGIRIQFKRIIENKKKSRFFSDLELDAMKAVERGTTTANTLRRIGKLGWGEGKQNTVLNALGSGSIGGGAGLLASGSLAGGIGLVLLPVAGTISGKLARNLTLNSAKMSNQLIRAGSNANNIAKVYLRNTKVGDRSVDDLAALLMRPDLNLSLVKSSTPIIAEAATKATQLRQSIAASSAALAIPAAAQEEAP